MSIQESEFNRLCASFLVKSKSIGDRWTLQDHEGRLLLYKEEFVYNSRFNELWVYVYCVTYSISYEVPEFYFSVHRQDGSLVPFEHFWPCMCRNLSLSASLVDSDVGSIVSEFEHPLLFRPFYKLHPCRTKDLMEVHSDRLGDKYLISWLSTISSLIGFEFSHRYAMATQ